ncbi:dihydrolipoyl dehydrogenase family protein [Xylanimonas protaetiae]|uniref:NAD(P)/FAD-dependent oxidoreductase n=1 Tax=Xylanimonas protaetiae TaxID=2509457 RepID=A0A4P6F6M5_9MICO|nr:NAD(P)/FAD-dependent oxidoreductase [Xylanimonas protaetiae]QAY70443.1 NAD(P)/FAD-dependent oxidoreductase [Xylanimonas protaetiae]
MTVTGASGTEGADEFDVIVVGGGPVGENAADRASRTGLTVALVEAELVGGECSYWACIPSKTLLRPGAALAAAAAVPGLSAQVEGLAVDPGPVLAWRDRMTSGWDDAGQVGWLDSVGVTLVRGHGRLAGERLVEVDPPDDPSRDDTAAGAPGSDHAAPRRLRARHAVVVATGSVPAQPDVPGLAGALPWSSREATSASAVPESLVVLGGGVVGSEMATAYADLGSHVTLLARHGLLSGAEDFAGEAVEAGLRTIGVDVLTGVSVRAVERPEPGGPVTVRFDGGGSGDGGAVTAAELLVATGRVARTADVGVETVGLEPGRPLAVDDTMAVVGVEPGDRAPWLYACGDVTGRHQTTHQGKYQGRVVGDVIAARFGDARREGAPTRDDAVPAPGAEPRRWSRYAASADDAAASQVVFTRPQVAWVGLTERAAAARGLDVRTVRYELGDVSGGSVTAVGYRGTGQLVVDTRRRVVVGATFVGPDAGELLHAATIAVVGEVPLDRLWHAVPAYPTVSEVWLRFLEAYGL